MVCLAGGRSKLQTKPCDEVFSLYFWLCLTGLVLGALSTYSDCFKMPTLNGFFFFCQLIAFASDNSKKEQGALGSALVPSDSL